MGDKIKLFIIDDHDVLRDTLKLYLSQIEDIQIIGEASNGQEAIKSNILINADVVLTDVFMPVMNGCELMEWIKRNLPATKILAMSINNQDQFVLTICRMGMNGYFLKDDSISALPDAIRRVAKGWFFLSRGIEYKLLTEDYLIKSYLILNGINKN